jgi:hypothetical protein
VDKIERCMLMSLCTFCLVALIERWVWMTFLAGELRDDVWVSVLSSSFLADEAGSCVGVARPVSSTQM